MDIAKTGTVLNSKTVVYFIKVVEKIVIMLKQLGICCF